MDILILFLIALLPSVLTVMILWKKHAGWSIAGLVYGILTLPFILMFSLFMLASHGISPMEELLVYAILLVTAVLIISSIVKLIRSRKVRNN